MFAVLFSSNDIAAQERFHATHAAMGTIFTLDLYASDEGTAERLAEEAFDTIDRLDDELSNYKPSSELTRIDREAGAVGVTTDPETFAFLERSFYWSRMSHGAFDITVGPVMRAWGFFFHNGRVPSEDELQSLRHDVGWQKVHLDAATRSVRFEGGRAMDLDPGSIGKGFAVDRVVAQLRAEGVTAAFLSAGGSTVYGIGAPPDQSGWPVIVPDPLRPGTAGETVWLKDESLSTGACTEKFFIKENHRYCHIFNPHTLRPVEGMLQTSVIDASATDSDALSTVAFVLTPEESRAFFRGLPSTKALIYTNLNASHGCIAIHWKDSSCGDAPASPKEPKP